MSELITTKGMDCAKPVAPAKSTLELYDEITILVDQPTALENLKILGVYSGCLVETVGEDGDTCMVDFSKKIKGYTQP